MSFLFLIFRIHLKELGKDLEDDLVQLVNNMPHLEKMRYFVIISISSTVTKRTTITDNLEQIKLVLLRFTSVVTVYE